MRTWISGIALALAAVGCDSKPDQTTAKGFLERFQQAEKAKDAPALWGLLAKQSREERVSAARRELDDAKKSAEAAEKLKKQYGLAEDPAKMEAEAFARAKLAKQVEGGPTDLLAAKFVEERTQGEQVILVVEIPGKGRREISLVREEETLRVKWDEKGGI
ncbi:MAG: hypothetical protein HYY17_02635 [Planctomycetes bacterium]|nr:hypothetical protein [Planctomycetota bacterium]